MHSDRLGVLLRGALLAGLALLAVALGPASRGQAADTLPIEISIRLDNVLGFSPLEKTYTMEGTLWLVFDAELADLLAERDIAPIDLLRFQNLVAPWDSRIEPLTRQPVRLGDGRRYQAYGFVGKFYSNEVDYRLFPFGSIGLSAGIEPKPLSAENLGRPVRVTVAPDGGELGARAGLSGYDLTGWRFAEEPYRRSTSIVGGAAVTESRAVFTVTYRANVVAALVKWVLPLSIVMLIMLLTPTLTSSFMSERLAVPPVILLTIALMQQSYRESLPPIPYLTFLDLLFAFSLVVTLGFFVTFIWAANAMRTAAEGDRSRVARRVGRVDRATQGVALCGYLLLVALSSW